MIYYVSGLPCSDELYHHGILGQKWGVRRFQNSDGTLTTLGKVRYGYKATTDAVGKAAKATGRAVGKAGKAVVKYEVDKFKRKHPWMMSNNELDAQILKAKKVNDLRTARETARGKTFVGKLSNTLWKSFGLATDKIAESFSTKLGQGFAERLLKSKEKKEYESLIEKMDLMDKQESMYKKKTQDKLGIARKEYHKHVLDEAKSKLSKADEPQIGSKKAVDAYAKAAEYQLEKERRRKLYGPGGTAYR